MDVYVLILLGLIYKMYHSLLVNMQGTLEINHLKTPRHPSGGNRTTTLLGGHPSMSLLYKDT